MYNIVNICINYPASTAVLVLKNLLLFFPTRIIEQTLVLHQQKRAKKKLPAFHTNKKEWLL